MDDVTGTYALFRDSGVIIRGKLRISLQTLILLAKGIQLVVTYGKENIQVICTEQHCDLLLDPLSKEMRGTEVNLTLREV